MNPTIDQYLLSTCLFIIDEFNNMYNNTSNEELKIIADNRYNEMDICVQIGYPFKQMAHYTSSDQRNLGASKERHDIYVESKDFKIELKYLKNWKSSSGKNSASKNWSVYQKDFTWLINQIRSGNKSKSAFVIGWFNCVNNFSSLIQLGDERIKGKKRLASDNKMQYFPFLTRTSLPTYITDLIYNYSNAYKAIPVNLIGEDIVDCSCIFLGNQKDKFHFAIYY